MPVDIHLIPQSEFARVTGAAGDRVERLQLAADMSRANALAAVKRAGSGHLGSSFSAMDIVIWLYYERMNTLRIGFDDPNRDVYFSSKGHDVPGLYAALMGIGALSGEKLMQLRRYKGLDGHPDVGIRGIEANSGSLGMGISKGRGIAWAKRSRGLGGHVYVMIGDGELQEGQNYEALMNGVNHRAGGLTVIVDHNKVQSDKLVSEIADLGNLEAKLRAFGWEVARCDGHDFAAFDKVFAHFDTVTDKPKVVILDTIKGRGVSFMEHPTALPKSGGLYPWHAGAPDDKSFLAAYGELVDNVNARLAKRGIAPLTLELVPPESQPAAAKVQEKAASLEGEPTSLAAPSAAAMLEGEPTSIAAPPVAAVTDEFVSKAFGAELVALAPTHANLVVLDGDLAADCKVRDFENAFPDQFIENGIAEQDMVSMAGGLARHGFLPVVNSFANFLAARANEQIYNNASEKSKIIYACHYAGLIPAGPGKSHQSIRDISLFNALPNATIVQPCNAEETRQAVRYFVDEAQGVCMLRLIIGPSPRRLELPSDYRFSVGRGAVIRQGEDAIAFTYGPVMLHETLLASEMLADDGFGLAVVNMPWLNKVDSAWLASVIKPHCSIYVVEDHAPVGGLGDLLASTLATERLLDGRAFRKLGVEGFPACGTPAQALRHHGLDGSSLAARISSERVPAEVVGG